jgi:hypothetical protein
VAKAFSCFLYLMSDLAAGLKLFRRHIAGCHVLTTSLNITSVPD